MTSTAPWPWWHKGDGPDDHRQRELLRAIWDLHAISQHVWVWRGQANSDHPLEPGMHTRVRSAGPLDDEGVAYRTAQLLSIVRTVGLDRHGGVSLTDLPLLARLQHHGAATPLLDVSLDPMVGLYMAVVSPNPKDDDRDGVLFAIRRPALELDGFSSLHFSQTYNGLPTDAVAMYTAPGVSDRLAIQRGHFIVGRVVQGERTTIPLTIEGKDTNLDQTWLSQVLDRRHKQGPLPSTTSDVGVFRVTAKFKKSLRAWLELRTGLTREFVYPTVWTEPHLDSFCASHGRRAPLPDLDVVP